MGSWSDPVMMIDDLSAQAGCIPPARTLLRLLRDRPTRLRRPLEDQTLEPRLGTRPPRPGFQIPLERNRTSFVCERDVALDSPGTKFGRMPHRAGIVFCNPRSQVVGYPAIVMIPAEAFKDVDVFHDHPPSPASLHSGSLRSEHGQAKRPGRPTFPPSASLRRDKPPTPKLPPAPSLPPRPRLRRDEPTWQAGATASALAR